MRIAGQVAVDRVLDAGCGKGKYAFWLSQEFPDSVIDACDISSSNVTHCNSIKERLHINNINFFVRDLLEYKKPAAYDFVYSNHVLEHIADNTKALANLVESLKPGGHIYIQVPNAVQKRFALGKKFVRLHERWAKDAHVGQTFTLDLLAEALEDLGCSIKQKRYLEGFWGELRFELSEMTLQYLNSRVLFAFFYPLFKLLGYIDLMVKSSSGNGIMVLARKDKPI
jgi:trans-aconitate methyltransferase